MICSQIVLTFKPCCFSNRQRIKRGFFECDPSVRAVFRRMKVLIRYDPNHPEKKLEGGNELKLTRGSK